MIREAQTEKKKEMKRKRGENTLLSLLGIRREHDNHLKSPHMSKNLITGSVGLPNPSLVLLCRAVVPSMRECVLCACK